jgi:hypothetical protein
VVPWKDLGTANDEYLSADSLPEETALCEPSKLQQYAVINLWGHWRKRQAQGHQGLAFISANVKDMRGDTNINGKGKSKKTWVDMHTPSRSPSPGPPQTVRYLPTDENGAGPSGHRHSPAQSEVVNNPPSHRPHPRPLHTNQPSQPHGDIQAVEREKVTCEKVGDTPEGKEDTPEGRKDIPEGREDTPEGKEDTPEGKEDTPEGRKDIPEGRGDTPEKTPNINSPKHHWSTKKGRFHFLRSLSDEDVYAKMLKAMERVNVSIFHYFAQYFI